MVSLQKLKLRLLTLNCYATEETGYDDVYLMLNNEKIWPKKKRQLPVHIGNTALNVEISDIESGTALDIEIWDYDVISKNDLMGHVPFYIDKPGGPFSTDMIPDPVEAKVAKYTIEWEIDYNDPE
jgi:hypothetical protein